MTDHLLGWAPVIGGKPVSSGDAGLGNQFLLSMVPKNISTGELRSVFSKAGSIVDIFISKKARPNRNDAFGFIRFKFNHFKEAARAIENLNEYSVSGLKLKVSMAKFQKGGRPFVPYQQHTQARVGGMEGRNKRIFKPALTHARMIVRTKAQNRIDARIRVLFESGCCEVCVKKSTPCGSATNLHCLTHKNGKLYGIGMNGSDSSKILGVSESEHADMADLHWDINWEKAANQARDRNSRKIK